MSKTILQTSVSTKAENPSANVYQQLSQLSLKRFCTKKLHEVEFVYPLTFCDNILLQQIVDTGKHCEHLSNVHFVTYEDVLDLVDRLVQDDVELDLPPYIQQCARLFVMDVFKKTSSMSLETVAIMTKLKIIESMYKIYRCEVNNMHRRKEVHKGLDELVHNCEPTQKGITEKKSKLKEKSQSKESKKSDKSKEGKTKDKKLEAIVDDYTQTVLEENEIIFDYNVDNHFQYFVLTGFADPLLLRELINQSVHVSAVVEVSFQYLDSEPEEIVSKLEELFETPKATSYLENTVWMKYRNSGNMAPKVALEEFLYAVKRINFIKRQHFAYITKLKLWNLGATLEAVNSECIEKYKKSLDNFPPELINIPLIVNALLKEVCWREAGKIYSVSDLTLPPESEQSNILKPGHSFQVHEEDLLKIGMMVYHETGRRCYDESLECLKLLQPLAEVDCSEMTGSRTVGVSTGDVCTCGNTRDLFDYFHLAIFSQMKRKQFEPKKPQEYYLTENLVTHNQMKEYEKVLPKGGVIYEDEKIDLIKDYHLKEDLSSVVLYQLIFRAMMEYSSWDRSYCSISKAVLLRFHDNLSDFGVDIKLWDQSLRTPVCLRDFCRFLVDDVKQKNWLMEHKLTDHAELNADNCGSECQGLLDMHIPETYEEYQYLLGGISGVTSEERKKLFDNVINELVDYPKSETLSSYCNDEGTFIAYDLGPQLCRLTGHTTIFHSGDGVKITVDTTRFLVEDPKCSVTVEADGNSLVFHKTRPWAFHFILKDGTILSFSEFETSPEIPSFLTSPEKFRENYEFDGEEQQVEEEDGEASGISNYNDHWIRVLRKSKISMAIPNFFDKPRISDRMIKLDDRNLDRLLELFKVAVYKQSPIYKISTKHSLRCLKRTVSPLNVPLLGALKRVLFKPSRKRRRIGGYSVLNIVRTTKKVPTRYDFKITLPNGVLISTLPRNKPFAEIKQEYKYKHHKEVCRNFYCTGVVVIKNFDGTTTILRSNGDIIQLSDESEYYSAKCAKDMAQIFRQEEDSRYHPSRCPDSPDETPVTGNFTDLYEFGDIPYTKKTLLQFDGKRISISDGKIREKQLYYVISEQDYHAEETFYEREDNMKCIIDKKGRMTFQFPDGTKITSWPEFEKDLIFVSKNQKKEGWVSAVINYKFEHPDYVTVQYAQEDRSTRLFLRDGVVKNFQNSFLISVKNNIALQLTSNDITFMKSCEFCDTDCICNVHLKDDSSKLVEVYDSYEKHLVCDRFGHWEINSDFIKGPLNKNKCNHNWRNEKHKFFIVNEHGGSLLWKDSFVENKVEISAKTKHVKVKNYMNKFICKQTVEFFTEVRENFINRFTTWYTPRDICLPKYKHNADERSQVYYVTFRILIGFQNLLQEPDKISELVEFLESRKGGDIMCLLKGIQHMITYATGNEKNDQDKLSFQISMKDEVVQSKRYEVSKTVEDVIRKWKEACYEFKYWITNNIFPPYFSSDHYLEILTSLKTQGKSHRL